MLITETYRQEQQRLHETTEYGTASIEYADLVSQIIDRLETNHFLDYGCGSRMNLIRHIKPKLQHLLPGEKLKYQAYDPGVPKLAGAPTPAPLVTCIDVLEHVEPDCIDSVLDHLKSLAEAVLFVTIHTGPAAKTLSDGRNAHVNQQPMSYWLPKLWDRFDIQTVQRTGEHQFYVIAYALPRAIENIDGTKAA